MKIKNLLVFLLAMGLTAAASTVAVVNDGGGAGAGHSNFDVAGYQFTNDGPITISALGIWVAGLPGDSTLHESHQVAIYDLSGNLQVSELILNSTVSDSQGYAYTNFEVPFDLPAGTWFIGAYYVQSSPDNMRDSGSAPAMAPGLTFDTAQVYFSGSAFDPNTPAVGTGKFIQGDNQRGSYFGPNFKFDAAVGTPEPATFCFVLLPIAGLMIRRRFKRAS